MQSTALALMSCENAMSAKPVHPLVPVYDAVIYCDLGYEPPWVYDQVDFIQKACEQCGIYFKNLYTGLYDHYLKNFGKRRTCSVPFWSIDPDGKKAKMRRNCTIDFKITAIHKFARHELLGYRKYQRIRPEDIGAHEIKIESQLYISRSRKRIERLTPSDCNNAECFRYKGKNIWNGF